MADASERKRAAACAKATSGSVPLFECAICCESGPCNLTRPVACPKCDNAACGVCVAKSYEADTVSDWGRCMFCGQAWSREFVDSALPKKFRDTTLKQRREDALLSLERSLLADTQQFVQLRRLREHARGVQESLAVQQLELEAKNAAAQEYLASAAAGDLQLLTGPPLEERMADAAAEARQIAEARRLAREARKAAAAGSRKRATAATDIPAAGDSDGDSDVEIVERPPEAQEAQEAQAAQTGDTATVPPPVIEKVKDKRRAVTVGPCPGASCRGFLVSRGASCAVLECGMCNQRVCAQCHQGSGPGDHAGAGAGEEGGHVCREEDVASVRALLQDTKPCPGCSVRIHKISGCDQMWCTQCHKVFSWRTGKLEERGGTIHNPHWFEWLRRSGNGAPNPAAAAAPVQPGAVCAADYDGIPRYDALRRQQRSFEPAAGALRLAAHVHAETIPKLRGAAGRSIEANRELRIDFLEQKISETEWKRRLQQREKKLRLNDEKAQVLEALVAGVSQLVRDVMLAPAGAWRVAVAESQRGLSELRHYINDSMRSISARYGSKSTLCVSDQWGINDGKWEAAAKRPRWD